MMQGKTIEIYEELFKQEPVNHLEKHQPLYDAFPKLSSDLSYPEFFEKFLLQNQPCIFSRELTAEWRSVKDWARDGCPNLDFLLTIVDSESLVPVSYCNKRYFNSQECEEESFGSYTEYWASYTQSE